MGKFEGKNVMITGAVGAAVLADLGVTRLRLITNNPLKYAQIRGPRRSQPRQRPVAVTPENLAYLHCKRDRMGHLLDLPTTYSAPDNTNVRHRK